MEFIETILGGYESVLHFVAEIAILTLELIGIVIIIIGSFRSISNLISSLRRKCQTNIIIDLGKALSLALEFKMGAEIIKTVIVHSLSELGILAIVIALRAALALLIHWEIKNEEKHDACAHAEKEEK